MKKKKQQTGTKKIIKKNKSVGFDVLYGINPVMEALKAGKRKFFELFVSGDRLIERTEGIVSKAEELSITVTETDASHIAKISGTDYHQNVAARVSPFPFALLDDVLCETEDGSPLFFLILDGIEDPMNLGALARTALGAGVNAMFIPKDRAAMPTPSSVKASAGALEHLPVVLATNITDLIRTLKKEGFWITGLDGSAAASLYDCDFKSALALVVGGEGRGLRELVGKNCDNLVFIPQKGHVSSLNASVAGALAMYEVVRQRIKL